MNTDIWGQPVVQPVFRISIALRPSFVKFGDNQYVTAFHLRSLNRMNPGFRWQQPNHFICSPNQPLGSDGKTWPLQFHGADFLYSVPEWRPTVGKTRDIETSVRKGCPNYNVCTKTNFALSLGHIVCERAYTGNRPGFGHANDNFNEPCAGEAFMPLRQILSSEEKESAC